MAAHSSTLAWKIPWMEEPGRLQSMGSWRVRQDCDFTFTFHFHALEKEMATHSSVLAWRISGTGEPGRLLSMGSHRVGHDWSDLAAIAAAWHSNTSLSPTKTSPRPDVYLSAYYARRHEVSFISETMIYYPYFYSRENWDSNNMVTSQTSSESQSQELNLGILTSKQLFLTANCSRNAKQRIDKGFSPNCFALDSFLPCVSSYSLLCVNLTQN